MGEIREFDHEGDPEDDEHVERARRRGSHRDVDLSGRDRVAMARAAAAGDPAAAEALAAGALGSEDAAVAGEAAAALAAAAAERARRRARER